MDIKTTQTNLLGFLQQHSEVIGGEEGVLADEFQAAGEGILGHACQAADAPGRGGSGLQVLTAWDQCGGWTQRHQGSDIIGLLAGSVYQLCFIQ